MEQRILQLQKEIELLKKDLGSLKNSSSVPLEVQRSFESTGFIKKMSIDDLDPEAYDTLNTLLPTITTDFPVLAFPVRWMKITTRLAGSGEFYIPIYTLSDI